MGKFNCAWCGSSDITLEHAEEIDFKLGEARLIISCDDCCQTTCTTVKALEQEAY